MMKYAIACNINPVMALNTCLIDNSIVTRVEKEGLKSIEVRHAASIEIDWSDWSMP